MSRLISKFFIAVMLVFPGFGYSAEEDYIEKGKQGIEAYRIGNLVPAMQLLQESAEKGYAPAQATLAYILDQSEENDEAFRWYELAAKQGYAQGEFGLGSMYAKGEGVERNRTVAGHWIRKAALQGYVLAVREYASALETGDLGYQRNVKEAFIRFTECHDAGDMVCTRRLVQAYRDGDLGQPIDMVKSNELNNIINPNLKGKK